MKKINYRGYRYSAGSILDELYFTGEIAPVSAAKRCKSVAKRQRHGMAQQSPSANVALSRLSVDVPVQWIEGIRLGRFASFAEIAEHEAHGERHIRLLAPLATVPSGGGSG
jgi:hypothetical protein